MSDDGGRFEFTRRRLLGSVAVTGVAGAASGAGTWAYYQDTESSTGNTIDAGTLDLKISDHDERGDGVSGTWTISDARPGGDPEKARLFLTKEGSLSADHVEVDFSVDETEADGSDGTDEADTAPSSADGMAEQFVLTEFEYGLDAVDLDDISDDNGNGIVDLGDLATGNDAVLDDLPTPSGGTVTMTMGFRWAHDSEFDNAVSGVNNDYQGDEFELTVTCSLHQDSSQDLNDGQDS